MFFQGKKNTTKSKSCQTPPPLIKLYVLLEQHIKIDII
jgi:hypothetical protein